MEEEEEEESRLHGECVTVRWYNFASCENFVFIKVWEKCFFCTTLLYVLLHFFQSNNCKVIGGACGYTTRDDTSGFVGKTFNTAVFFHGTRRRDVALR